MKTFEINNRIKMVVKKMKKLMNKIREVIELPESTIEKYRNIYDEWEKNRD